LMEVSLCVVCCGQRNEGVHREGETCQAFRQTY
jgi:hypothetical protein